MKTVYLLVGVPCSGKSWICEQVKHLFTYVHHDGYIGHINQPEVYVKAILAAAKTATRPILAEAPFSISQIKVPLEGAGMNVTPIFILEMESTLRERYQKRERKEIPKGHLTRQRTYAERAGVARAFTGTSSQVLAHLKTLVNA